MRKAHYNVMFISCFIILYTLFISIGFFKEPINSFFSNRDIKNPTYNEMIKFIENDTTDEKKYHRDYYNCLDFTNDVLENAKKQNIRVGFVHVFLDGRDHAIVCFDTTDKGLYFLEPQADVLYTEIEYEFYYDYQITKWNNDII